MTDCEFYSTNCISDCVDTSTQEKCADVLSHDYCDIGDYGSMCALSCGKCTVNEDSPDADVSDDAGAESGSGEIKGKACLLKYKG